MLLLDLLRQIAWQAPSGPLDLRPDAPSATDDPSSLHWQDSSLDLMNGLDVTDFSETISGVSFQDLFLR